MLNANAMDKNIINQFLQGKDIFCREKIFPQVDGPTWSKRTETQNGRQ